MAATHNSDYSAAVGTTLVFARPRWFRAGRSRPANRRWYDCRMQALLETLGVVLLALAGVGLGRWFSKLPKWYWLLGYLLPAVVLVLLWLRQQVSALFFVPPFSWLTAGRTEFALAGFMVTLILTTPLSRIPTARVRALVVLFMAVIVVTSSVLPFIGPVFIKNYLANLRTDIDHDGICLQSTDYNCGPASAVTALRRLGIKAEEGQLAIWAHTNAVSGTQPDVLAESLRKHYAGHGVTAEYLFFKNLPRLEGAGAFVAVIRYAPFVDHYVALLEVRDGHVVVGDPLVGKTTLPRAEFEKKWRHSGVALRRK